MARLCNGTTDRLSTSEAISGLITAAAGTVSLWAITTSTAPTDPSDPFNGNGMMGDTSGFMGLFQTNVTGTGDRIWACGHDTSDKGCASTYTTGVWTHWTWQHGGGTLALYKNGVQQSTVAVGNISTLTGSMRLARTWNADFWGGTVAEVGVWNIALAAPDITALALGLLPFQVMPGSLTAYWPLWGAHAASPEPNMLGGPSANQMALTGTTAANHAPVVPFTLFGNDFSPATAAAAAAVPLQTLLPRYPPTPQVNL